LIDQLVSGLFFSHSFWWCCYFSYSCCLVIGEKVLKP